MKTKQKRVPLSIIRLYKMAQRYTVENPRVKEAKRLLWEVKLENDKKYKDNLLKDKCRCNHERKFHGASYSINYTEGFCKKCKCRYFMIKER